MANDIHNLFPDFMTIARPSMRGFRSCAADVSDYITIDDTSGETPIVTQVSRKFPGNVAGLVTYRLFRSYSTECAIFAATHNHNFLFVRDNYSATTSTQLGKWEKELTDERAALLRVNLYQFSYTVHARGYNNTHTYNSRFHISMDYLLSAIFSSVPQYAISKQSDDTTLVIKRSKFPLVEANNYACLFVPSMRRALAPLPRLLYGVDIERYFETQ